MTLKTHFETRIGLALLISGICGPTIDAMDISDASKIGILAAILVGVTAGSVYPDIDLAESNLNAENVMLHWENNFDHRGIVHTLINVIGVSLPFLLMAWVLNRVTTFDTTWIIVLCLSMSAGCVKHMLEDTFTPKGILWLYPFSMHRFRIPFIRNYVTERIFRILVTGSLLYKAIYYWSTNPY
jgi:membrane-bound metal-dependent hydrolase YbcI (DUF457 family)